MGNDLLCDDGVGFAVARHVRELVREVQLEVLESGESGLALLELIVDYDTVVIVDAFQSGTREPGEVTTMGAEDFGPILAPSAHFSGLAEVLELGRRLHLKLPASLAVVGIEVEDAYTFRSGLTDAVAAAVPLAAAEVIRRLGL